VHKHGRPQTAGRAKTACFFPKRKQRKKRKRGDDDGENIGRTLQQRSSLTFPTIDCAIAIDAT
jgi:hypothetical protein